MEFAFCRVAIRTTSYPYIRQQEDQGYRLFPAYCTQPMTLPLVYAVCIGFMLIMAVFFVGGAVESHRSH